MVAALSEVDAYSVPVDAFGDSAPNGFFEILGRILALNSKIEYLMGRLDHLPSSETAGVRKVEQFRKRYETERRERNAIVHSHWLFGADEADPQVIAGFRYKTRNPASGHIAKLSVRDVPGSAREQVIVKYTLEDMRKVLRRTVTTMMIGTHAFAEVSMTWAAKQLTIEDQDAPSQSDRTHATTSTEDTHPH
jgi:hypothetical protein